MKYSSKYFNQTHLIKDFYKLKVFGVDFGYLGLKKESDFLLIDKLYILEDFREKK